MNVEAKGLFLIMVGKGSNVGLGEVSDLGFKLGLRLWIYLGLEVTQFT